MQIKCLIKVSQTSPFSLSSPCNAHPLTPGPITNDGVLSNSIFTGFLFCHTYPSAFRLKVELPLEWGCP